MNARRVPRRLIHVTRLCLCVALVLSCFVFPRLANLGKDSTSAASAALSPPPEGNGYTYSRSIAIDHTKVPNNDQANFPVLISGTYSYLATVANGGRVQNASGYDVIFASDSGCTTKLNHEVETYNAGTGAVNYWVKIPTVSHSSDTVIYMCYGNASITASEENKNGVWDSNFKIVAHLGNGTTLSANDSTSNASHGTITGATAASGGIDGGASFNGSSNTISFPCSVLTVCLRQYRMSAPTVQVSAGRTSTHWD